MTSDLARGDVWWVDWSPGRGSEQLGRRPALIVQTDVANSNSRYPNVIVVAVSTKGRPVPFHVPILPSKESGLKIPSWAKCEQVLTISKERLQQRLGQITQSELRAVDKALRLVLEL